MQIEIKKLVKSDFPTGSTLGRKVKLRILEQIERNPNQPSLLFLDFNGVEAASASFLRVTVFKTKQQIRSEWPNYYPVVANVGAGIVEELLLLVEYRNEVLMACSLDDAGDSKNLQLLGELEPKQKITFYLVQELGETRVRELMEKSPDSEDVGRTAWNNRLASLVNDGLVIEQKDGRAKQYRPLPIKGKEY